MCELSEVERDNTQSMLTDSVVDIHVSYVDNWCTFVALTAEGVHDMVIGASMTLKHARVKGLSPCRGRGGTEGSERKRTLVFTLIPKEKLVADRGKQYFAVTSAEAQ